MLNGQLSEVRFELCQKTSIQKILNTPVTRDVTADTRRQKDILPRNHRVICNARHHLIPLVDVLRDPIVKRTLTKLLTVEIGFVAQLQGDETVAKHLFEYACHLGNTSDVERVGEG